MRVFTVLALRRSGCHAIAQWIGGLFDGPCQYCNMGDKVTEWIVDGKMVDFGNAGRELLPEDTPMICGKENQRPVIDSVGILSSTPILHIRDPFNNLASQYRLSGVLPSPKPCEDEEEYIKKVSKYEKQSKQPRGKEGKEFVRMWMEYALEYLGKFNFLSEDLITTNYNQWLVDEEYRRELASRLGLPFSDKGFESVPKHGGGSSFNNSRRVEDETARQDRLARFKLYSDREDFWNTLNVPLLWELAEEIFPEETAAAREEKARNEAS